MLSGAAEPLLDGFAVTGTSLLYCNSSGAFTKIVNPASGSSVAVIRVTGSRHGGPIDLLGGGDRHVGRRETPRRVVGPAGADVSGTVEQQFGLAAILDRAKQRQRGANFG
jgi:hypothetical protein